MHYMDELIHTADGLIKSKGLPKDIVDFLVNCTGYREEVNGCDFGYEGGEIVRNMGLDAANLCYKYGLKYVDYHEYDEPGHRMREVYSDGTKGDWEP